MGADADQRGGEVTLADLLPRLESVRERGNGRHAARCPAHAPDKNPSLSIAAGEKGILLRCWVGCTIEEICRSLGIAQRDLFFDALDTDPSRRREAIQQRDRQRQERERHQHQQGALTDALKAADDFVSSRRGLEISGWSDEKLNNELDALADAYHLLEHEDLDGCLR